MTASFSSAAELRRLSSTQVESTCIHADLAPPPVLPACCRAPDNPDMPITKRLIALEKDVVWDEAQNAPEVIPEVGWGPRRQDRAGDQCCLDVWIW